VKPAAFEYFAPTSVEECVQLLVRHGDDAKVLAGGQSLVPLMNLRFAAPLALVDLNRIPDLAYIRDDGDAVAIGAMTRHHDVATSELVQERCPLLARAASHVGYPAIRHRGTMGGSIAHADPAAELPCAALALDAEIVVTGPAGSRTIAARDLFVTHFTTVLEPTDLVKEVRVPASRTGDGWSFLEFSRKTGDFALAMVAVDLGVAGDLLDRVRIGVGSIGDRPLRAPTAEAALVGRPVSAALAKENGDAVVADVVAAAGDGLDPYRRQLVATLARRALAEAVARTGSTA
jgi:carbon-monoxide dehydrogenase medium subunit